MQQIQDQRKKNVLVSCFKQIGRCTVSCILVLLTQFALTLVPHFFPASSLLVQLTLSVVVLVFVLGLGRWCRRIVGVYASAPALVFFNLIFIWAVYIFIVRQAIPYFISIVFNIEVTLLILGVCSILSSDPGLVTHGSSDANKLIETKAFGVEAHNEGSALLKRVRYCKSCKAYIKGFDHHCPAFGNCVGQNNYVLFMILLAGFLTTEASYIVCSSQFSRGSQILGGTWFETDLAGSLVVSTMLFSLLQVIWQGVFFTWHLYCICFNIRTDEWINWKKYPEFQFVIQSQPGESFTRVMFKNPYDNGYLQNVKEFLSVNG
ncbi:palmitoyltransferase AKR1-like isoform X1 [Populus nigra]|uniref:palmitoyltransferase AKR1-like isoform X1 n=1 Tax=Populus nigra TaxID=3691 RepID=UPI002B26A36F|nr:palmitoyltransferase AKR1-like isoform X1 [Populus nigra]